MSDAVKMAIYAAVAFPVAGLAVIGIVESLLVLGWFSFLTIPVILFCTIFCLYKLADWATD